MNKLSTFGSLLNYLLQLSVRLFAILGVPLFVIYMVFPPMLIIDIPYWIITDRSLMSDWCDFYGIN